jgi:hypothetical protein
MRPDLAAILLATLLAGCASLPGPREPAPDPVTAIEAIQAAQLKNHLLALLTLVSGTPTEQAEVVAAARQGFEGARQGPAALHFGLVLTAPVHPARDPEFGLQLLREALARPELLSAGEHALAMVELERVSAELRLGGENLRLVNDLQQQERERTRTAPSTAATTRQLQAAQEENARLRRELLDAREKLDAIAEFERRQADRPPASEGRNP